MFNIDKTTKQINITRGDIGTIQVTTLNEDGSQYKFQVGDIVRIKVFKKKDCGCIELQKDVEVKEATNSVDIQLLSQETRIGNLINKPTAYWYEIELNPDTYCQTIIGYDEEGEKVFMLYPEGDNK